MKKLILAAVIVVSLCTCVVHADISPEKRKEIEKMLQLTGMEKLMDQMRDQMISSFKAQSTSLPDAFWEKLRTKLNMHELKDKIIPVYDKYYTLEDIKAINAFYESPAGRKVTASMPQIMKESMVIGQEWGEKVGKEAAEEIQKAQEGKK